MSWYESDAHENGCENAEYFECTECKTIVHESERNQCPVCMLFIPRTYRCVCDDLNILREWREASYA